MFDTYPENDMIRFLERNPPKTKPDFVGGNNFFDWLVLILAVVIAFCIWSMRKC